MGKETTKSERPTFRLLKLLKHHFLEIVSLFLLAFIPLYPKFPLAEVIPGYIVRVRLEDLFIGLAFLTYLVYLKRGKVDLRANPLTRPVLAYLVIGFLSTLSAVFITKTVPLQKLHLLKLYLHLLRRVEYFFPAFLFFAVVRDLGVVKRAVAVLASTVVGVTIYGFGQKYLRWPAFSTMNREFAKGWRLYLTEHARVNSTFGGHYDLAAFLVLALAVFIALALVAKTKKIKVASGLIVLGAYLLLLLTASRASFLAYLLTFSVLVGFLIFPKGWFWAVSRWSALILFSFFFFFTFGDMAERFSHITGQGTLSDYVELLLLRYRAPKEPVKATTDQVASLTDQPPVTSVPERPPDVYKDIPDRLEEVVWDKDKKTVVVKEVPREYSETAVRYGLSSAIRFDVLWPRAWQGFRRNPLLGSGYSTLTKARIEEFTEAESTDNDFLRNLGETGLLGMAALAWIFLTVLRQVRLGLTRAKNPLVLALTASLGAATLGLLVNAFYIDIFEASKVAEPYWAWVGLVLGAINISVPSQELLPKRKQKIRLSLIVLTMMVIGGGLVRFYRLSTPLADWHSWRQADTAAVARNFTIEGIDLWHPRFDDLSSIPSGKPNLEGYRFVEFPFQALMIAAAAKVAPDFPLIVWGRLFSIGFSLLSLVLLYLLVKRHSGEAVALLAAFFFAFLPYNIYYSRVILPEPLFVCFTLAGLYGFDLFLDEFDRPLKILIGSVAVVSFMFSLLLKPFSVFFWPAVLYLVWQRKRTLKKTWLITVVMLALATLPFWAWRWWAGKFPEGIPDWRWLLNSDGIRLRPAWFRWLLAERLAKLILGYLGVVPFVLGILIKPSEKEGWYYHLWLLGTLAYLVIFATGNVTHDYYQIILLPMVAVFLARGIWWLILETPPSLIRPLTWLAVPTIVALSLGFSWFYIRDFFNINCPSIVAAGRAVDELVPPGARVIAPYNGDTAFLFQTKRKGWPMGGDIPAKIAQGAEYYVTVDLDTEELEELERDHKVVEKTAMYEIVKLIP